MVSTFKTPHYGPQTNHEPNLGPSCFKAALLFITTKIDIKNKKQEQHSVHSRLVKDLLFVVKYKFEPMYCGGSVLCVTVVRKRTDLQVSLHTLSLRDHAGSDLQGAAHR